MFQPWLKLITRPLPNQTFAQHEATAEYSYQYCKCRQPKDVQVGKTQSYSNRKKDDAIIIFRRIWSYKLITFYSLESNKTSI